ITIETELPEAPIYAYFDSRLIAQSLTNLIKNAVEAFETVNISESYKPTIAVQGQLEGNHARISVSDNGRGWPKDNRQRLLEPYMTTREKGTGLGLAIVAKIIEQHGGLVELVDAEPDANGRVGACVTFTLPLTSPQKTSTDGEIGDLTDAMIAQMEEPLLAAVVRK
ncbi:MAG TPA: ATP-binding protein, partial [Devosia sp.]|nr:ATP-binding protein [Devosia sp.]